MTKNKSFINYYKHYFKLWRVDIYGKKIKTQVKGFKTQDGAGVNLVRVLGHKTVNDYDPILMLDSFDSTNPDDYTAGFLFIHRGIETISYI